MSLPIDVVQSVKVVSNPYGPEYARLTGAVSSVETAAGSFNRFHASVQNLFVRPQTGGRLCRYRVGNASHHTYRSRGERQDCHNPGVRIQIHSNPGNSLPQLERDTKFESVDSFTQTDVNLTLRQSMTASLAVYPQKLNYLGFNTFTPQPATPDLHQCGFMTAIQHRDAIASDSLLFISVQLQAI